MAIFGLGYNGVRRPLETVVVVPPGIRPVDRRRRRTSAWRAAGSTSSAVVPGRGQPPSRTRRRQHATSSSSPRPTPRPQFKAGKQSVIGVKVNTVDPIRANYAGFLAANLRERGQPGDHPAGGGEGEGLAVQAGQPDAARIPPEVVAAPTQAPS